MGHWWLFNALMSLYAYREEDGQWKEDQKLDAHSDWVRDVGWAPSIGLPTSTIASCSQVRVDAFKGMIHLNLKLDCPCCTHISYQTFSAPHQCSRTH